MTTERETGTVEVADQLRSAPARAMLTAAALVSSTSTTAAGVDAPGFRFLTEREPGPWICCAPVSGAMVAGYAVGSRVTLEVAHRIRTAAGKRHAGGMKPSELRAGVKAALGLQLHLVDRDERAIAELLRAGWALALPLTYGGLPRILRRWSPDFTEGHMGVLAGLEPGSDRWGWWDPLAPAGWRGEYVDPDAMMGAAWDGISGAPRLEEEMRFTFDLERWLIDGDVSRPVVTVGAPLLDDGAVDWTRRLAFVSDAGGANPRLELFPRTRLVGATDPTIDHALTAALAAFRIPQGDTAGGDLDAQLAAARQAGARQEYARWIQSLGIPSEPTL